MSDKIIINYDYYWRKSNFNNLNYYFAGQNDAINDLVKKILLLDETSIFTKLDEILIKQKNHCSLIMDTKKYIIAFVDHCRTSPIFYSNDNFVISNDARLVKEAIKNNEIDNVSLLEFQMSGFVTGKNTIYKKIKQLECGERIIFSKKDNIFYTNKYFNFDYNINKYKSDQEWVKDLEVIMNKIFNKLAIKIRNKKIFLPLSAGLDSRLIASMLHQKNVDNIYSYSYGPHKNYESKGAEKVAKKLNLKWNSLTINRHYSRILFFSKERKKYWNYADNFCSIPNPQEFLPTFNLVNQNLISKNVVFINGQSGDYITGGHIPKELYYGNVSISSLLDVIIDKHYSLWKNLKTTKNIELIKNRILSNLKINKDIQYNKTEIINFYEKWEFNERQCKLVINGQRAYEYFGCDWELPLWNIELVNFYKTVPIKLKYNQFLYKKWLNKWNYMGLFNNNITVWRWPGLTIIVPFFAKIIELFFGKKIKNNFYVLFKYFGHSSDHFAPYKYFTYFQYKKHIRNSLSLNIISWLKENNIKGSVNQNGK